MEYIRFVLWAHKMKVSLKEFNVPQSFPRFKCSFLNYYGFSLGLWKHKGRQMHSLKLPTVIVFRLRGFSFITCMLILFIGTIILWRRRFPIHSFPSKGTSSNSETEPGSAENVDNNCKNFAGRYYSESNLGSETMLSRAKRAKLVRDTLIFFPKLKQMWCLVPKVRGDKNFPVYGITLRTKCLK